jgi:type II secretory pathway component PulC
MSLRTLTVIGGALALLLLITLAVEWDRGRKWRQQPPASVAAANPLEITLLPEFNTSELQERKETVERPLFVPTRRPAPPPDAVEAEPSRIERGLFVLSGTAIQGQTRIAFLRNAKDNKPKTVRVGDTVEGMNVSVITADKVVLTAGGQEEELLLKVAAGPKGAVTPAALPQQQQAQPGQPGQPQPGQPAVRQPVGRGQAASGAELGTAPVAGGQATAGEAGGTARERSRAARNNRAAGQ